MKYELRLLLVVMALVAAPCLVLSAFSLQALLGQKLIIEKKMKESYSALASTTRKHLMDIVQNKIKEVDEVVSSRLALGSKWPISPLLALLKDPFFKALFLTDKEGSLVYPQTRPKGSPPSDLLMLTENYHVFENAYIYEFQKEDFLMAISEYQKIVTEVQEQKFESLGIALMSIARCNLKANRVEKSLETYQYLTTLFRDRTDAEALVFMVEARKQMAEIYKMQKDFLNYYQTLLDLLEYVIYNELRFSKAHYINHSREIGKKLEELPREPFLSLEERASLSEKYEKIRQNRKKMLEEEKMLENFEQVLLQDMKLRTARNPSGYITYRLRDEQSLAYYQELNTEQFKGHLIFEIDLKYCVQEILRPVLEGQEVGQEIKLTVITQEGAPIFGKIYPFDELDGDSAEQKFFPIVSEPLSPVFPFWHVAVYLKNVRSLEELSRYRSQVYFTGLISVILILLLGIYVTISTFIREVKIARKKSDFVSNITHELKTPLTAIKMFVETLMMGRAESEDEKKEYLQIIAAETERLSSLIDRILSFARMEQKKRVFNFVPRDIGDSIEYVVNDFQNQMLGKSCSIRIEITPNLPEIPIDEEAMREALMNLLSNAYKYNNKTEKIIEMKAFLHGNDCIAISVKDNGIGIPRNEFKRIFQKFYRVQDTITREIEGTGLGLSLVKTIVKAHRGKIKVQSKIDQGSEFIVILPIKTDRS